MNLQEDPEFFEYLDKLTQSMVSVGFEWAYVAPAIWLTIELADLGFTVNFSTKQKGFLRINAKYNDTKLAVLFYAEFSTIDITSSVRLPGTMKFNEDKCTYFQRIFGIGEIQDISFHLQMLLNKTMKYNVNMRYR